MVMKSRLDPSIFARIMALPLSLRHDVLEFLGSTPVAPLSAEMLIATVAVKQTERRKPRSASAN